MNLYMARIGIWMEAVELYVKFYTFSIGHILCTYLPPNPTSPWQIRKTHSFMFSFLLPAFSPHTFRFSCVFCVVLYPHGHLFMQMHILLTSSAYPPSVYFPELSFSSYNLIILLHFSCVFWSSFLISVWRFRCPLCLNVCLDWEFFCYNFIE